jgi:hypothetical protein
MENLIHPILIAEALVKQARDNFWGVFYLSLSLFRVSIIQSVIKFVKNSAATCLAKTVSKFGAKIAGKIADQTGSITHQTRGWLLCL